MALCTCSYAQKVDAAVGVYCVFQESNVFFHRSSDSRARCVSGQPKCVRHPLKLSALHRKTGSEFFVLGFELFLRMATCDAHQALLCAYAQ